MSATDSIFTDRVSIYQAPSLDSEGNLMGGTSLLGQGVRCLLIPLQSEERRGILGQMGRVVVRVLLPAGQECQMGGRLVVEASAAFGAGTSFRVLEEPVAWQVPFTGSPHHLETVAVKEQD